MYKFATSDCKESFHSLTAKTLKVEKYLNTKYITNLHLHYNMFTQRFIGKFHHGIHIRNPRHTHGFQFCKQWICHVIRCRLDPLNRADLHPGYLTRSLHRICTETTPISNMSLLFLYLRSVQNFFHCMNNGVNSV